MLAARAQELDLIGNAEKLIAENAELAMRLTAAVDRLVAEAEADVSSSAKGALSVQRLSARALVALVALSLLTSILIVWLYVGRNIVRRLTGLSDGMLAIAGGRLHTPVAAQGSDEIAAMGRAVEIFRRNTVERDELLAEKAQAAERLEQQVKERTAELTQSVEELRALGEVTQAVSSTLDLQTLLDTIVAKAAQLSGTEAGVIYVFDEESRQFQLRATYGMSPDMIAVIRDHHADFSEAVGLATQRREPDQVADLEPSSRANELVMRLGYRARLVVPLLSSDRIVGALVVRRKAPGEFARGTIELLQTFAAQSVLAIQNARLFAEIEDKSRQLELASQHKSQFLASMSHELRTPLNAIIGLTEMMVANAARFGTDKAAEPLGRVHRAGTHLLGLINQVLDLSKIEAGKLELSPESVSVAPLVDEVIGTAGQLAEQNKNRLMAECQDDLAPITADPMRLRQILLNLLSNACKFTKQGEVALRVRKVVDGRDWVEFAVSDTGIGMTTEQLGQAVRGVQPGRGLDRATLRRHRARPRHHPQARAHDGGRRDGGERARQGIGVHGAPAGARSPGDCWRRLARGLNSLSVSAVQSMSASRRTRPSAALPRIDAMCQQATHAVQRLRPTCPRRRWYFAVLPVRETWYSPIPRTGWRLHRACGPQR